MLDFIKKHLWLFLVIALLLLFPQSLTDQARLNMRVIITGIGIDYKDDKYIVTSQIVLPASGSESGGISAHINYITAEGDSVSEGVQKVSYKIGKVAELSHIEFILVGKTMQDHNIASSLDYFFRNYKLKNSVMLLGCNNDAKEEIQKTSSLELSVALGMQKVYTSNEASLNGIAKSYVEFINDTYSASGTSVLDTLEIITGSSNSDSQSDTSSGDASGDSQSSGGQSSTGTEGQQGSASSGSGGQSSASSESSSGQSSDSGSPSSSGGSQGGNIAIQTPLLLYKRGNLVGKIEDKDAILGYYYTLKNSNTGNIFITDFSYAEAQNANINIQIDRMKKSNKINFINGKPVHEINIKITEAKIDEIASKTLNNTELYKTMKPDMQAEILKAASQKIESFVTKAFTIAKEQNFDVFSSATLANKFKYGDYQNYITTFGEENFVKDLSVIVNVTFDNVS